MANLTTEQIDELKDKGIITQVIPSEDLAGEDVDSLKIEQFITHTDPSEDIEEAITPSDPISITIAPDCVETADNSGRQIFTATITPESAKPKITWSCPSSKITFEYPPEEEQYYGIVAAVYNDLEFDEELTITASASGTSASCILKREGLH